MLKKLTYILLFLIISCKLYSQPITWQRTYGTPNSVDLGYSIVQTPDNGYLATGFFSQQMFVMRLNPYGDTLWFKLYPYGAAKTMEKTSDGNYIIANFSARLIKININGDTLWTRSVNIPNSTRINAFKETPNGSYIACGSRNISVDKPYLVKLDINGNIEWEIVYNQFLTTGKFSDITVSTDNNYLLTGNYGSNDTTFIMKTNLSGAEIWFRSYGAIGEGHSILNLGNRIFLGGEAYFSNNPFLSKLDISGNLIWYNKYDTIYSYATSYSAIITADGGCAYTGQFDSTGNFDGYVRLMKTDSLGNVQWRRAYGFNDWDLGLKLRQTSDSGYIITGQRDNFKIGEIYVIKTDKNGNTQPIGIQPVSNLIPVNYKLHQNYPNPFNPITKIKFSVPVKENIQLNIYDVLGRQVKALVSQNLNPGTYEAEFDASGFASGIYFYSLEAIDPSTPLRVTYKETKKMILIK